MCVEYLQITIHSSFAPVTPTKQKGPLFSHSITNYFHSHRHIPSLPNATNTSANLDHGRDKSEGSELEFVVGLVKVALLSDVDTGLAPAVFGSKVGKAIKLLVTARAGVGRVIGDDKTICAESFTGLAAENITLDENLVVGSAVDGLVEEVFVQVVVDVLVAESTGGTTSTHVLPVVVVVADVEVARVKVAEGGVVSYK